MNINKRISQLLPTFDDNAYKGQMGKFLIVGGSSDYTGAPFFAAISTLKLGCDLAHIICPPEAAIAIKCYSPELMVHPILELNQKKEDIIKLMYKMHAIIIGPGLGQSSKIVPCILHIIEWAKDLNKPIIIDADGLNVIKNNHNIISGYKKVILTPNANEFKQIYSKILKPLNSFDASEEEIRELANKLNGVTICRKGKVDIITDGLNSLTCEHDGSPRRCGGQGDLLSGTIGVLLHWLTWKNPNGYILLNENVDDKSSNPEIILSNTLLAAYGACCVVKESNKRAYKKKGRSTLTGDMIEELAGSLNDIYNLK